MKVNILMIIVAGILAAGIIPVTRAADITVYKSASCDCCKKWIRHLEQNGFKVVAKDVSNVIPYKIKYGIKPKLASCHTAVVSGYVVEGHVPAADIKRMLKQRPKIKGLSVPGMPIGSPGMEMGQHKEKYNVLQIKHDGSTSIFSRH